MKLYGFPPSPNTWKVRAVANQLEQPLDFELVDLTKPRTPDYLALNPTGRTPTLVDGDWRLWESTAIMQYLANGSANSLWPNDARTRADIMRWQSWGLAHWNPACGPLTFERFFKKVTNRGPADAAVVAKALDAFNREARVLDDHLAKRPCLVGGDLTLADFSIAAALVYAQQADIPVDQYPRVRDWLVRIIALPSWVAAAPPMPVAA
jgi:glutathione S-transferase